MGIIVMGDGRTKPEHFAPRVLSALGALMTDMEFANWFSAGRTMTATRPAARCNPLGQCAAFNSVNCDPMTTISPS
jgi:hypothetical protein